MQFHEATLDNGLKVIGELNDSVHSVAIGFFVRTGARDESVEVNGVSHFLEHMAFKGNEEHSADDVNRVFDEIGAEYNAQTGEEATLYYAAILPEYLPIAFEMLSGLLTPSLREDDFNTEKKVILEEISMYEDQPMHVAYDHAMQTHFKGHALGKTILGPYEGIEALTVEQMRDYHATHYRGGNITLAVAGNTDWDQILELAKKHCSAIPSGSVERQIVEPQSTGGLALVSQDGRVQQHVVQMTPAPPAQDELRFAAELLTVIVGDDGGSRIYWELVDPGLVEFAELGYYDYDGAGLFTTWIGCLPDKTKDILARMRGIYQQVNLDGITTEELEQARNKVASRVVLRSERPMGRLSSLGGNWVSRKEYRSVADDLETLRSLTVDDIRRVLDEFPLGALTTSTVGPLKSLDI
ncbi:MAG: M16 family metallopeptidase [Planctomycetota bacterium]|jgi:predicted Zn-dependent peptidase